MRTASRPPAPRYAPMVHALDLSTGDPYDWFPHLRELDGLQAIKATFTDFFLAQIEPAVADLEAILAEWPADVVVSDILMGRTTNIVHDRDGPVKAVLNDTALPSPPTPTSRRGAGASARGGARSTDRATGCCARRPGICSETSTPSTPPSAAARASARSALRLRGGGVAGTSISKARCPSSSTRTPIWPSMSTSSARSAPILRRSGRRPTGGATSTAIVPSSTSRRARSAPTPTELMRPAIEALGRRRCHRGRHHRRGHARRARAVAGQRPHRDRSSRTTRCWPGPTCS